LSSFFCAFPFIFALEFFGAILDGNLRTNELIQDGSQGDGLSGFGPPQKNFEPYPPGVTLEKGHIQGVIWGFLSFWEFFFNSVEFFKKKIPKPPKLHRQYKKIRTPPPLKNF